MMPGRSANYGRAWARPRAGVPTQGPGRREIGMAEPAKIPASRPVRDRLILFLLWAALAVVAFYIDWSGACPWELSKGQTVASLFAMVMGIGALYQALMLIVAREIRRHQGAPTEIGMVRGLLRLTIWLLVFFALLHAFGKLSGSWAAIAGFAGLLMGWSLQAPVSGFAAWVLVNIKRPFRIGDRVMLPAWGLIGDVTQVGTMYTVLNQVGGTVGSEEAAGRNILIPNAMLFSNVVINYTPQQIAAVVLDEVVVRITYDSDWDMAERILLEAAEEVTSEIIRQTGHRPYIRSDMYDYGVYLRLRYMTAAMDRPRIVHEITKRVFNRVRSTPEVDFAIPYVYSYRVGSQAGARRAETPHEPAHAELPIDDIVDPEALPTDPQYAESIADLTRRIAAEGLLQPIVVERRPDGRHTLIAGHLRYQACRSLGWKTIPAIVHDSSVARNGVGANHGTPQAAHL